MIKTVCCSCNKVLVDGETVNGNVSHGICKDCIRRLYPEVAEELEKEEANDRGTRDRH